MEHLWILIVPFWISTDDIESYEKYDKIIKIKQFTMDLFGDYFNPLLNATASIINFIMQVVQ